MCRVEFSKIGKRDVTFIREMRVYGHCYLQGIQAVATVKCSILESMVSILQTTSASNTSSLVAFMGIILNSRRLSGAVNEGFAR